LRIFLLAVLFACNVHAQTYPNKPIRLVVPFAPGGSSTIVARSVAAEMEKGLGQSIVIENKGGGGGNPAMQDVARADADGYTLLITHIGSLALNPYLYTNLPFDVNRDFIHVSLLAKVPNIFVVHESVPAKDAREFVALVKKEPGKYYYGSAGNGSAGHLAMEYFKLVSGIELQHVPYKGSADLMLALQSGQLMAGADSTGFAPQVEAGKLRVLNTWGEKRLAKFPDAPTLKELGYDIVQNSPFGIGAPKGTPPDVVKKLHDGFKKAMEDPSYVATLGKYDMLPDYKSSAQYTKFAQDTVAKEKVLIEKLGLGKGQ